MNMYLSYLLIDTGDNPDRPRPGRLWIRNRYHVHQRLCMAFPNRNRKADDPDFIQPFQPADFGVDQVHVPRQPDQGFLFRIDPLPGGRVAILVQSATKPDWDYAFHNAGFLLAAPPEIKSFAVDFRPRQRLRFRLLANPTRKIDTKTGPGGKRRSGRRVPLAKGELAAWLIRKAATAGFNVDSNALAIQPSFVYFRKTEKHLPENSADEQRPGGQKLRAVLYEGIIEVADPEKLRAALVAGIGSAKGFGFGLLSVAACR
ncbi:MAG: type I-E CRISPR-associated protein Cas6/Cse3/CasE [Myxococcales bacterium]|nr:type I-E CRISPR-associated protein Cas6/Cse3/CasE [Myxococcales bacterium]